MPLSKYKSSCKFWDVATNTDIPVELVYSDYDKSQVKYYPFKAHISVNPLYYFIHRDEIIKILDQAVTDKIICTYKAVATNVDMQNEPDQRAVHLPYTLYLHNEYDPNIANQVAELFKKIEGLLKYVPAGDKKHFFGCDIEVSPHITFRQTMLNKKEYLIADEKNAPQLAEAGRKSKYYIHFKKAMQQKATSESKDVLQKSSDLKDFVEEKKFNRSPALKPLRMKVNTILFKTQKSKSKQQPDNKNSNLKLRH
jgi:hypothetical protein